MCSTFIYTLSDPYTNEIRYVGKANNLTNRLRAHIHEAKNNLRNRHKCNWIKAILKKGEEPIIEAIEEVSIDSWKSSEIYWISQLKAWGFRLLNRTEGGDSERLTAYDKTRITKFSTGQKLGFKHSDKTKKLIKEKRSLQIITVEHKNAISQSLKGRPKSLEHSANMSKSKKGVKLSKERVLKSSLSKTKKVKEVDEKGNIKIWNNAEEIADYYKVSVSSVRRAITNEGYNSKVLRNKYYYYSNN